MKTNNINYPYLSNNYSYNSSNYIPYQEEDRMGFAPGFILGGITGGLLAPAFYPRPCCHMPPPPPPAVYPYPYPVYIK